MAQLNAANFIILAFASFLEIWDCPHVDVFERNVSFKLGVVIFKVIFIVVVVANYRQVMIYFVFFLV